MKAKSVYDIILGLNEEQKEELFILLNKPLPKMESTPWIRSWKGLSKYLAGIHPNSLRDLHKEGLFEIYKFGKTSLFRKEEIDAVIRKIERKPVPRIENDN